MPNTTYATPSPDADRTTIPVFLEMDMLQANPSSTFSTPSSIPWSISLFSKCSTRLIWLVLLIKLSFEGLIIFSSKSMKNFRGRPTVSGSTSFMTLEGLISIILLTEPDNGFDPSKSPAKVGRGMILRQNRKKSLRIIRSTIYSHCTFGMFGD